MKSFLSKAAGLVVSTLLNIHDQYMLGCLCCPTFTLYTRFNGTLKCQAQLCEVTANNAVLSAAISNGTSKHACITCHCFVAVVGSHHSALPTLTSLVDLLCLVQNACTVTMLSLPFGQGLPHAGLANMFTQLLLVSASLPISALA